MSEEHPIDPELESVEEEYEEITSDEVDRVVGALEDLAESVESENIRDYLETASQAIYALVYDETDGAPEIDGGEIAAEAEDPEALQTELGDDLSLNEDDEISEAA